MNDKLAEEAVALDLAAIEARANAAAPGPWKTRRWTWAAHPDRVADMVMTKHGCLFNAYNGINDPADGEFIAHARADIPALIAEIRRLRAER